jgi:hypothetical protein
MNYDMIDEIEARKAAMSLIRWFQSQGINLPDACSIMAIVTGLFIGQLERKDPRARQGISILAAISQEYAQKVIEDKS